MLAPELIPGTVERYLRPYAAKHNLVADDLLLAYVKVSTDLAFHPFLIPGKHYLPELEAFFKFGYLCTNIFIVYTSRSAKT